MTTPVVEVAEIGFKNNKSSSQAGILSDVRDVYNHGATLTSVAGDVHYHNYAPGENGLVRREESSASHNQPELPSQLYSRLLMGEGRGYPLMGAKLPNELPEEYRLHGVMIGDVGIVTQDGYFDVLFNICEPADGSINGGYVPEGFVRLERPPDNRHNYRRDQAYEAGAWAIRGDIRAASHPLSPGNNSDEYQFACGSEQGGALVLPSGASKEDLINRKTFLEYASRHGARWYEFANDRLGRDIANGSIYLITGYDKTSTWGAASFFANSTIPRFRMRFTGTRWDEPGRAFVKQVRHPEEYTNLPENQCIFLRGYKVTLSNRILAKIFGTTVVQTSPMDRIMEEPDRWSIFNLFHVGNELAFVFRNRVSGGSTTNGNTRLDIPEPHHLILTPTVSPLSSDIHPSNLVNLYLLEKFPGSDMAVTHDSVWCSYLEAQHRNETSSSYSLFEFIDSRYTPIQNNNAVYLVDFPDPEILAAAIEGGIEDKSCTSHVDELSSADIDPADEGVRAQTDTITSSSASDKPPPTRTAAHSEHAGHVVSMAEYRISKSTGAPAPKRASLRLREAIQELEEGDAGEASVSKSNSIPKAGWEQGSSTVERKTLLTDASDHDMPKSIAPDPLISKSVKSQGQNRSNSAASDAESELHGRYMPGARNVPSPSFSPSWSDEPSSMDSMESELSTTSSATRVDPYSRPQSKASLMKLGTPISDQFSPSIQFETPSPTTASFTVPPDKRGTELKNTILPRGLSLSNTSLQSADLDRLSNDAAALREQDIRLEMLDDIPSWLRGLRLHKYHPCFDGLSWKEMVVLDGATLEAKGITALGARRRLLEAFEFVRRKMGMESPGDSVNSATLTMSTLLEPSEGAKLEASTLPKSASSTSKLSIASPFAVQSAAPSDLSDLRSPSASIFSPLINISRSSFESECSSYHSIGEEHKDRSYRLISEFPESKPPWDDLPKSDFQLSSSAGATDDEWDPEEYVAKHTGLKRADFIVIQNQLFTSFENSAGRISSSLRRRSRRPSTSQRDRSTKGLQDPQATGPSPQFHGASSSRYPTPITITVAPDPTSVHERPEFPPVSADTLHERESAKAVLREYGNGSQESPNQLMSPSPTDAWAMFTTAPDGLLAPKASIRRGSPSLPESYSRSVSSSSNATTRNEGEAKLAEDQQTIQAPPTNPSRSSLQPWDTVSQESDPLQISTSPKQISASTRVGTVSMKRPWSMQSSDTSKIRSQLKKLRGTPRARNSVAEDESSHSPESHSALQTGHSEPDTQTSTKATVIGSWGVLNGLMTRLRGKQASTKDQSATSKAGFSPRPPRSTRGVLSQHAGPKASISANTGDNALLSAQPHEPPTRPSYSLLAPNQPRGQELDDALKQLWEAAEKLGIEPTELNAVLARSTSTASRLPTKSDPLHRPQAPAEPDRSQPAS